MIEEAVRLDAELLRIRSLDADAPEAQELKRRISRIASNTGNSPAAVAAAIVSDMMAGETAEEAIHKLEAGRKGWIKEVEKIINRMRASGRSEEKIKNYVEQAAERATIRGR
jgi:alkanesulfonate monooxygenase SsuD/methylene tetrahydromethanopterin reductase-like flavin-dependent oxidoreductase (luciferase family)